MTRKIELQFRGYQPNTYELPLTESPFEWIDSVDEADELIWNTLMGDEDDYGWVTGEANGEDFQVRIVITKPVLEVCTNIEWLLVMSPIDFSEVYESDREDAAKSFITSLSNRLEDAGFETIRPNGNRIRMHGWNGAQFKHSFGPVGTFSDLSSEEIDTIQSIVTDAEVSMHRDWIEKEDQ